MPKINLSSTEDHSTISSPQDGLIIYNTTASGSGSTAVSANSLYIFNGTSQLWERLNNDSPHEYGDIKYGMQSTDHKGWVQLDGRALTSLTTTQQAIASLLSISTTLPDLTNKVVKQKGSLGSEGGSDTVTILQNNLPDVDFLGTTSENGSHTHNVSNVSTDEIDVVTTILGGLLTNISFYKTGDGMISSESNGNHTHSTTVNSGGLGTGVDIENPYFSANAFIYLGY